MLIIALKSDCRKVFQNMATVKTGTVTQSFFMSNKNDKSKRPQIASVSHSIPAAAVTAYNAAADDAARAATTLGVFLDAEAALSLGVRYKVDVGFAFVQNAAIPPAVSEFVFAFDKVGISFTADGEYYTSSIPARDDSVLTLSGDGITIDLGAGASDEVEAYVAAFNTLILSEELVQGTVANMYIRS